MTLEEETYVNCPGAGSRFRNSRSDDFPVVFEHDIPLTLDECGGPVIGLNGKAIGITIARVGQHGCMAIPADHRSDHSAAQDERRRQFELSCFLVSQTVAV